MSNVNKKLILVILIPSVISFIPSYYFMRDYMSYFYWTNHDSPCNCPKGVVCLCPVNTGLICKNAYNNHDYSTFHDDCTIYRFDGEYGSIQLASIEISIIPTFLASLFLCIIYLKQKLSIKK